MGLSHKHLHKRQDEGGLTTIDGQVYSITYVTASPTFDGVIGGYTTLTGDQTAPTESGSGGVATSASGQATSASNPQTTTGPEDDGIPDGATALAKSSSTPTTSPTSIVSSSRSAVGAATSAPSSAATNSSSSDGGMSTGAKAGLAIGILAGIGLIAAILLFCIGRKKKQRKEREARELDEKTTFGASRNAITMQKTSPISTTGPAPRLSIRPMSRNLLGDLGFGGANRRSAGNMLNTVPESAPRNAAPPPQNRPQSPPENPFADPQNPFADPGRRVPIMAAPPKKVAPPVTAPPLQSSDRIAFTGSWPTAPMEYNPQAPAHHPQPTTAEATKFSAPVSNPDDLPIMGTTPSLASKSPAIGSNGALDAVAPAVGAAAAVAASKSPEPRAGQRHAEPHQQSRDLATEEPRQPPREQTREMPRGLAPSPGPAPSPAFPAAAGAPSSPNPSVASGGISQQGGNVYRVLMDFTPSMDDELELKTGTLVRLLHEYDDGWALCIRLDRSHQGVVPRTCLAAKPSKPKPSHLGQYARGPGQNGRESPMDRPQSPAGAHRGRNSPAMGRPMSPGMGRPMSPNMVRPMSPGGRQMRPQSPAGGHRGPPRGGPPGPGSNRPMSPAGGFNQAPRPLSPGPMRGHGGPQKRSQSPGPYGAAGRLPMPSAPQRRRSNSANAMNFQDRRLSPPGPSKLGQGRPMSPNAMGMAI